MKQRVITGLIFAVVFFGCLFGMYTPLLAIGLVFCSVVAVNEIADCIGLKNLPIRILSLLSAAVIPVTAFYGSFSYKPVMFFIHIQQGLPLAFVCMILADLVFMILLYKKTKFSEVAIMIFSSVAIPKAFSLFAVFRDGYFHFPKIIYERSTGIFFILFCISCSWVSDIFALLVGRKFGKRKLCPDISPKKTVEGAIGGVLCNLVINIALWLVFNHFWFYMTSFVVELPVICVLSVVLSVVSIFGDLAASVIKRNFGVKDFGKLLPGHGGIMDRFDSTIFVFAACWALLKFCNLAV